MHPFQGKKKKKTKNNDDERMERKRKSESEAPVESAPTDKTAQLARLTQKMNQGGKIRDFSRIF